MILEVRMHGKTVGRLADHLETGQVYFEYESEWLRDGVNLSPLNLEFQSMAQTHANPQFHGLHGVFCDSLPDHWGMTVLAERLKRAGINSERSSALLKLSYLGARTVGALEYYPQAGEKEAMEAITLAQAERDAAQLMGGKKIEGKASEVLAFLIEGGSAGGAKPKIHAYVQGDEIIIGGEAPAGFEAWLIKLSDLPSGHKDSKQSGAMEFAFMKMAGLAGIAVPEVRLFNCSSNGKKGQLFGIKRFDRHRGAKIHMHSLSGLLHVSHQELAISYEDFILRGVALTGNHETANEIFRRAAFNVIAGNCDDHGKNFAFLHQGKEWVLSPAFDITYSPGMNHLNAHAMTINGSRNPSRKDLLMLGKKAGVMAPPQIIEEVIEAVMQWGKLALKTELKAGNINKIKEILVKNMAQFQSSPKSKRR